MSMSKLMKPVLGGLSLEFLPEDDELGQESCQVQLFLYPLHALVKDTSLL